MSTRYRWSLRAAAQQRRGEHVAVAAASSHQQLSQQQLSQQSSLRQLNSTREGMRFERMALPIVTDGSQPRSWARMTFPSGKSDATSEGSPAPARPHVPVSARGAIDARAPR